jgi:hypothetical protein
MGYFAAIKSSLNGKKIMGSVLKRFAQPATIWRFLVLFGLLVFSIFLLLVGPDVALINAASAKGGDFEGFGDSRKFLFLKTFASLSIYAACFIPYILVKQRDWLFFFLYVILTMIAYLNSISRTLILYQLILPMLVVMYVIGFKKKKVILSTGVVISIAFIVFFFGKPFVSVFLSTGEFVELAAYQGAEGLWNAILRNYESLWFSVDAGWRWFFKYGFTLPTDVLMAPIGFIPSWVLENFGAGWLYYGNAETKMTCINTIQFGLDECTVPPLITGMSAYMAPIAGAIAAGFVRFFVYGRLDRMWLFYKNADYSMTWIPYFLFMLFIGLTSFIPTSIALASFTVIIMFFASGARRAIHILFQDKKRYSEYNHDAI